MTDAEKLEALVRRAVESGWHIADPWDKRYEGMELISVNIDELTAHVRFGKGDTQIGDVVKLADSDYELIFNHDFARALFGEEQYVAYQYHNRLDRKDERLIESGIYPIWKWHLVRAVSHNNPIDYMYKAVFGA